MTTGRKERNPFYTLVVVAGTAFVLTAGAYWMEALSASGRLDAGRAREQGQFGESGAAEGGFMDRWGTRLLIVELAVLGVAAVLAMCLDRWRSWRSTPRESPNRSFQP